MSQQAHRIAITGAAGFVGTWLRRSLRKKLPDAQILCLTQDEIVAQASNGEGWQQLDIRNRAEVEAMISAFKPTGLVHLAAVSHVQDAALAPDAAWDVNVGGTINLSVALQRHCPSCRMLFTSSSEVYGGTFNQGHPLDESALLDPNNLYAASKAAADLFLGQMGKQGLKVVRFRPFNHTGPGQSPKFVLPSFAAQIVEIERRGGKGTIGVGNLEAQRDFLDVRDVVAAYVLALARPQPIAPGIILNLASGQPRRIGTVLDELIARSTAEIEIKLDPRKLRPVDIPLAVGNANSAREMLGWAPNVPWDKTLDDTLNALRLSQPS